MEALNPLALRTRRRNGDFTMKTLALSILGILAVSPLLHGQTDAEDIQRYLAKAARGEAGVNPRDQTAARSGDPYAQARIQKQLANNRITEQQNRGSITPAQAAALRQQSETNRQAQDQRIELERIRRQIEWQNAELARQNNEWQRELQRIRMENARYDARQRAARP